MRSHNTFTDLYVLKRLAEVLCPTSGVSKRFCPRAKRKLFHNSPRAGHPAWYDCNTFFRINKCFVKILIFHWRNVLKFWMKWLRGPGLARGQ